jgi:uncharacterized radical SAM superfamily Fe-S cluster-containing enzyme
MVHAYLRGAASPMNRSFCNTCGHLVTARQEPRGGQVFLVKECPRCGTTETLISADSGRYLTKRHLDGEHEEAAGCGLGCLDCRRKRQPSFIFLDVTNRCNSNCPICINNTPSMGFLFEPPLEYFAKVFDYFAALEPRPTVQLFGGEPTVRQDLFEIIAMARARGLRVRVVTNGLRLANEDYCRRLVESRATILIAYDGANAETYRVLRGNEKYLAAKLKALDNIARLPGAKVGLMTCIAKGFNEGELPELIEFCHQRRAFVRGVYFLPLAQTWKAEEFDLEPPRMTTEDLEIMLNDCFPHERIDFVPAGVIGELGAILKGLDATPPPFAGAHPNCESLYVLVSDGERYVPLARYLKGSLPEFIDALFAADGRVKRLGERLERGAWGRLLAVLGLRRRYLKLRTLLALAGTARRNVKVGALLKGRGPGKVYHLVAGAAGLLLHGESRRALEKHTTWQGTLQVIVLPFEDDSTLETERLERCPNSFAFYDPESGQVNYVPTCAWSQHKVPVMRRIAEHYGTLSGATA